MSGAKIVGREEPDHLWR